MKEMFTFTLDFFTYNDEYDEENYDYQAGPDSEDYQEETDSTFLPVFVTAPRVYRVTAGHTARLECQVDRLGPMVLSWRRVNNGTNSYIATGTLMMLDNKRFSVLSSTTSSTLLITLATPEDAGQYICEISSNPPVHMTHWLRLKGEQHSLASSDCDKYSFCFRLDYFFIVKKCVVLV